MATRQETATLRLRELILSGDYAPGEWLREKSVAEKLGISRTPARISMQILEQEGLLKFFPNRGFRVTGFSLQQVTDAVDVRGTLEGMACRLVARNGLSAQYRRKLEECIELGRRIVSGSRLEEADTQKWSHLNREFHDTIVMLSQNHSIQETLTHNNRIPLASAGAITFFTHRADLALPLLKEAQKDHEEIFDALTARDSGRAEHLMREHARRSRDNKLFFLQDIKSNPILEGVPGSKLVSIPRT